MRELSFGIFTIFIAFVLFSVIKNVFFNANQLSKRIRYRYLVIAGVYFAVYILGISTLIILPPKGSATFISMDISFFALTIAMIYPSLRMDSNDTSAYFKWYYSVNIKGGNQVESKTSLFPWIMAGLLFIVSIVPYTIIWIEFDGLKSMEWKCYLAFSILSPLFVFIVLLENKVKFGPLIRMNMKYNFLWEMAQQNTFKSKVQLDNAKYEMSFLFSELFVGKRYYKKNEAMNKQILGWINSIEFDVE